MLKRTLSLLLIFCVGQASFSINNIAYIMSSYTLLALYSLGTVDWQKLLSQDIIRKVKWTIISLQIIYLYNLKVMRIYSNDSKTILNLKIYIYMGKSNYNLRILHHEYSIFCWHLTLIWKFSQQGKWKSSIWMLTMTWFHCQFKGQYIYN